MKTIWLFSFLLACSPEEKTQKQQNLSLKPPQYEELYLFPPEALNSIDVIIPSSEDLNTLREEASLESSPEDSHTMIIGPFSTFEEIPLEFLAWAIQKENNWYVEIATINSLNPEKKDLNLSKAGGDLKSAKLLKKQSAKKAVRAAVKEAVAAKAVEDYKLPDKPKKVSNATTAEINRLKAEIAAKRSKVDDPEKAKQEVERLESEIKELEGQRPRIALIAVQGNVSFRKYVANNILGGETVQYTIEQSKQMRISNNVGIAISSKGLKLEKAKEIRDAAVKENELILKEIDEKTKALEEAKKKKGEDDDAAADDFKRLQKDYAAAKAEQIRLEETLELSEKESAEALKAFEEAKDDVRNKAAIVIKARLRGLQGRRKKILDERQKESDSVFKRKNAVAVSLFIQEADILLNAPSTTTDIKTKHNRQIGLRTNAGVAAESTEMAQLRKHLQGITNTSNTNRHWNKLKIIVTYGTLTKKAEIDEELSEYKAADPDQTQRRIKSLEVQKRGRDSSRKKALQAEIDKLKSKLPRDSEGNPLSAEQIKEKIKELETKPTKQKALETFKAHFGDLFSSKFMEDSFESISNRVAAKSRREAAKKAVPAASAAK
jgi:hypothetical protein